MKPKKALKAITSWLVDPQHVSSTDTAAITVEIFHAYLQSAWETHLTIEDHLHLEDELTIFISTSYKKAPKHHLYGSPETNIMFDITNLTNYDLLFHNFTNKAKLPYYLLHQEHDGRLLASFNPYLWENTSVCQAKEITEFRTISLLAATSLLPEEWKEELFGSTPFLHYHFGHDMNEPLPTWDDCDNELIGWVTNPQQAD